MTEITRTPTGRIVVSIRDGKIDADVLKARLQQEIEAEKRLRRVDKNLKGKDGEFRRGCAASLVSLFEEIFEPR